MPIELRLLGPVQARADGHLVDLGHARQQCVLAALLIDADRAVPPDRLLDRVWADHPPAGGRATLYGYLSRLRRALAGAGGVDITRDTAGYRLRVDPMAVDLHRYRKLLARARSEADRRHALELVEQALRLWQGQALAGLPGRWAEAQREALEQERLAAETERIDLALECGHHDTLVAELTARTAAHPLDERLAGQTMLALYRAGRPSDALDHYRHTRQRLAEELGADPGPALRELHQRILTADPTLNGTAAADDGTEPVVPPRQLPTPPTLFVGRHDELDRLDAALPDSSGTPSTVVISAIAGVGGIGKTWLALHWAHRNLDRFPDGHLFVDLRGFGPHAPMDPEVAVRGFLDALGAEPDRIPAAPHAQAALFRSLLADRRMLLVLDNAADTAQVIPLLPGSQSCTVVVTSRNRLPGLITSHGAHHLPLDVLPDAQARALLSDRLGADRVDAEPVAAEELVRLCGGLPLALSIITARALTSPHLSLATLAAELRDLGLDALDDDEPTASLSTVLSWSHHVLTSDQKAAFALLGIAPGHDISLTAAAVLTGLPPKRAWAVLRGLEQASLVSQHTEGRYHMHDLIRRYAVEKAEHDLDHAERDAALRRLIDFYLHSAHTAERLLAPHRTPIRIADPAEDCRPVPLGDAGTALAWFTAEHSTLLATQRLAARCGRHTAAWQLAWALDTFHSRRGHRHDKATVWRIGLEAATQEDDLAVRALAHRMCGNAAANIGLHDEATENLLEALRIAELTADRLAQAQTHHTLAWILEKQGHLQRALDHITQALPLFRALDQPLLTAQALNGAGWLQAQLGDYESARVHCEMALDLVRRHGQRVEEAGTLDSLGLIAHRTGRHVHAVAHYQEALALYRDLGYTYYEAETLDRMGHPQHALGREDEGRASWQRAIELYRQQGRDEDVERVLRQLDNTTDHGSDRAADPSTAAVHTGNDHQ